MNSKFDKLLENDDRYKLFIYQILQIQKEAGILTEELKRQMDLSDFKLNQLLDDLINDLVNLESKIEIVDKIISSSGLSSNDYQKLRLIYFKKSIATDLLVTVGLYESISLTEFIEMHFTSASSVYRIQNEINEFLIDYDLKFKAAKIKGEEKNIRSFYFQLFFNFYGGSEFPFTRELNRMIFDNMKNLSLYLLPTTSQIQKDQLYYFLGIQIIRMKNSHSIKKHLYKKFNTDSFLKDIKITSSNNVKVSRKEIEFLHLYLMLNDRILFNENYDLYSTELEDSFINFLENKLKISQFGEFIEIVHDIHVIAQRWFNFKLPTTTFISIEQFEFFRQSYPLLHELINEFLLKIQKSDGYEISAFEKTYLYYEFMFCLLAFDNIRKIEQSIKVFVDFSGGINYNRYISENIKYFKYLNIQVAKELSDDNDIYISDFSNSHIECQQIIWKSPPLDSDWEEFANAIVKLKERKNA